MIAVVTEQGHRIEIRAVPKHGTGWRVPDLQKSGVAATYTEALRNARLAVEASLNYGISAGLAGG